MATQHLITVSAVYMACYLLGAINFSLIFAEVLLHKNLRKMGSGNPGFTNLLRLGNKKLAVLVLLLDIGRAWLVLFVCARIPLECYWPFMAVPLLLGNLFPIFHGFRGGKGIAMSIGIVLALCPLAGAIGAFTLIVMTTLWKRVSVGSIGFLVSATVTSLFLAPVSVSIVCGALTTAGFVTHRQNLKRLINGNEPEIHIKGNERK